MSKDKLQDTKLRDKELIERRLNQLAHEITRWAINIRDDWELLDLGDKEIRDRVTQYKNLEQVLFTKIMME